MILYTWEHISIESHITVYVTCMYTQTILFSSDHAHRKRSRTARVIEGRLRHLGRLLLAACADTRPIANLCNCMCTKCMFVTRYFHPMMKEGEFIMMIIVVVIINIIVIIIFTILFPLMMRIMIIIILLLFLLLS